MAEWHKPEEFDYGTGEILLLMKANPKKKNWRHNEGLQPEGEGTGYKIREEIVTKTYYTKEWILQSWYDGERCWKEEDWGTDHPFRREGDKLWMWCMSRTAWDSIVAWMWKKDLIADYLKTQDN